MPPKKINNLQNKNISDDSSEESDNESNNSSNNENESESESSINTSDEDTYNELDDEYNNMLSEKDETKKKKSSIEPVEEIEDYNEDENDLEDENDENLLDIDTYNDETFEEKNIDDLKQDDCIYEEDGYIESENNIENVGIERLSSNELTHFEKIRLIGIRTKQLMMGAKPMIKTNDNMTALEIAEAELKHKTLPLIIKRTLPNNHYELWHLNELKFIDDIKYESKEFEEINKDKISKNDLFYKFDVINFNM